MACIDGIDPADFESGILDPADIVSPDGVEISVSYDDTTGNFFAVGHIDFEVNVSPINYIDAVEFDFSTSNGSASAGTHYTARTGVHVTIPAGTGLYTGQITVLKSPNFHGDKTLTVTISTPVNATIATAAAVLTIHYDPVRPPTDPADLPHFNSWPTNISVYNQFSDGNDGACTAYAATAGISAHEYLDKGAKVRFDADRFWDSDGQIASQLTALVYARDHGAWTMDGSRNRQISRYSEIDGSSKSDLIARIKRNIHKYGPVYCCSIWYTQNHAGNGTSFDWNTSGSHNNPNNILPDPSEHGNPKSCLGHATIIVGWDNNIAGTGKGGFLIQSSHGSGWGHSGRSWLLYKTITTQRVRNGGSVCDGSTGGPTGRQISDPWFQFFRMELKHGG